MLAPFNASPAEMGAVGAVPAQSARQLGLSTMLHWNVLMIAPPLVITPEEARAGLELIDEALAVADAAVRGLGRPAACTSSSRSSGSTPASNGCPASSMPDSVVC